MNTHIHPNALVEPGASIGRGTRVSAFAHILSGASIGEDCNVCDHVFIEGDVVVGSRVTIKSGVQLWDGVRVEDDVFIGPNATFTNDKSPSSKRRVKESLVTTIRAGAIIGANATILPGITVEQDAVVEAGAVVMHDVPINAIVAGNPASIVGYVATDRTDNSPVEALSKEQDNRTVQVGSARLVELPFVNDLRGNLTVAEVGAGLPFQPKRCFVIFDVPSREVRGQHAHRTLEQLLVCLRGQVSVVVDDGRRRAEVCLDRPNLALYIPARVWGIQYKYSKDAVLMVFASDKYDANDYIRDYRDFLKYVGVTQA